MQQAPPRDEMPHPAEKRTSMTTTYRSYRLASRPQGAPTAQNFEIA